MNDIRISILTALHAHGEIHGTKRLACLLNVRVPEIRRNAVLLAAWGLITIEQSPARGRGHCTVYRDAGALNKIAKRETS